MTDSSAKPTAGVVAASALAVPFLGLVAGMQGAAVNLSATALVSASRGLHMTGSTQALAASVQTLAVAASVVTSGLIADRIGRRHMLLSALVIATVGQLIVAASPVTATYMLGMAVTGIGMGATYGSAFGYLSSIVPKSKLASSSGVFTACVMLSSLILTVVGGVLCGIDWRYAFLLIPAMSVAALIGAQFLLPKLGRLADGSSDVPGQTFLALGVVSFLYGCSELANSLTSPRTIIPILLGVVLLIAFFVRESVSKAAFFPVELFRSRVFLAAVCAGFIFNFGTAVSFLQVTNLWQYVTGLSASEVSVWQIPLLVSGMIAGVLTGRMIGKVITDRVAILGGAVMVLAGGVLLAMVNSSHSLLAFTPGLILAGSGVVVAAVPFGSLILREAPADSVGPVTSSRTTIGQMFYTLGFALSMVAIDRLTDIGVIAQLKADGVSPTSYGTGLDALSDFVSSGQEPTSTIGKQALQGAATSYGHAFSVTMIGAGVIATIVGLVAFFLLANDRGEDAEHVDEGQETGAPLKQPMK